MDGNDYRVAREIRYLSTDLTHFAIECRNDINKSRAIAMTLIRLAQFFRNTEPEVSANLQTQLERLAEAQ